MSPSMPNTEPDQNTVKIIHVVAGIIYSPDRKQLLIARRPDHLHMGGYWEFPGGKLTEGEPAQEGLERELHEELGIQVTAAQHYMEVRHDYPDKSVFIEFWKVWAFKDSPVALEGQVLEWVPVNKIGQYRFPDANKAVVSLLGKELHANGGYIT